MAKGQTHRRIHKIKVGDGQSAEAAIAYLADAQPTGDYYTEAGSALMLWLATDHARTYLGLGPRGGAVSRATMAALLNGRHPVTGDVIRAAGQDGTMVGGIDVVMNPAPKSVSVLWAVGDEELRHSLQRLVYLSSTAAMRRMLCEVPMVRDTVAGVTRHVLAHDWAAVQAIHTTARLTANKGVPDPQLHVHNVLFGAISFDGRLRALDSLPMTRYHRELDAEAASILAEELRLMGFPIRRVIERKSLDVIKNVKFELDGIPASLVEAMSARSREIGDLRTEYKKVTGRPAEGPGWERFVADHRGMKAKLDPDEMGSAWRGEAAEHGFDREALAAFLHRAEEAKAAGIEERGHVGWAADQLRREILEELCREHALVPEADVNRLLMQLSIGLMGPVPAWRVLARMYGAGDLLATTDGKMTTLEVLAAEQRAARAAKNLLDAPPAPAADSHELESEYKRAEEQGRPFDEHQRHAVALATSGARLVSITGPAGSGKSDASQAMTAIWQRQGRQVAQGQRPSSQAGDQEQPPRWARPLAELLADEDWWRSWLPRLYELLGCEIGGPFAAPDSLTTDERGYVDLMAYLFPPLGRLAWNSPGYGAAALADRADRSALPSSAGPRRGHVWEPVIRHVACALAALEACQVPGADPYRVIGVQAEISGPWLALLGQLLGRSPAGVGDLPRPGHAS